MRKQIRLPPELSATTTIAQLLATYYNYTKADRAIPTVRNNELARRWPNKYDAETYEFTQAA